MYIENPKTMGSGVLCAIPQKGYCPVGCVDCFFNSKRSYLEPLDQNTPNMPSYKQSIGKVIRVNDGFDSSIDIDRVLKDTAIYDRKFYNTSLVSELDKFDAPFVLTCNPGKMTDKNFYALDPIPRNLMMVRVRVNTWNWELVDQVVDWYTKRDIMVILTFMAYLTSPIPKGHKRNYVWRVRVSNPYWCIKRKARERIVDDYATNKLVDVCGGRSIDLHCRYCGTCLREYHAAMERIK